MGEPNTTPRGRKRKLKSSPKSNNKRKASTSALTNEVLVKQEPFTASPVSLSKDLELPTAEISHTSSIDDPQQQTRLLDTLEIPIFKNPKNLTDIPNEIFVQICANLPPSDLFSLTLVCKKIKNLLCSLDSKETQAIWRTSRTRFLRFLQSAPPTGMDEKSYIALKQVEKGCQFCQKKDFVKVYWEFRVRCCESCLDEHTMSRDELYINHEIPSEVFRTLPHVFRDASNFYWSKAVSKAKYIFYEFVDEKEQQDWVEQQEEYANKTMNESIIHKQEEQYEHIARLEECLMMQSQNPNYTPQAPTPQQRIFNIRQPQLNNTSMNFTPMSSIPSMSAMPVMPSMPPISPMDSLVNMATPTIPSMGLTSPQLPFQQYNQIVPQMQNIMNNRSQFMITTPPSQQYQQFLPRITRQVISQQQQMIPSHIMTGAPRMLTQSQTLTPQMVSPHCFGGPQFRRF